MIELIRKDFYFLRHGETDWNLEHRGMGQQDIPLNARGEEQAVQAAHILRNEPIKSIYHSPLSRAKRTAQIISQRLGAALIEIPELMECCWGEKEGQIKGKWTEDWIAGASIPGAENFEDFLLRSLRGLNTALLNPGPILIVSHGGVFWGVQKFARLGSHYDLRNCVPVLLRAPSSSTSPWGLTSVDPDDDI
ncbi:MAG: histidine phosphatase family protein [Pseudobdellovibrionaceae bacterium]